MCGHLQLLIQKYSLQAVSRGWNMEPGLVRAPPLTSCFETVELAMKMANTVCSFEMLVKNAKPAF